MMKPLYFGIYIMKLVIQGIIRNHCHWLGKFSNGLELSILHNLWLRGTGMEMLLSKISIIIYFRKAMWLPSMLIAMLPVQKILLVRWPHLRDLSFVLSIWPGQRGLSLSHICQFSRNTIYGLSTGVSFSEEPRHTIHGDPKKETQFPQFGSMM